MTSRRSKSSSAPKTAKAAKKAEPSASLEIPDRLAVGHQAEARLKPHDEELYRAFQSNLLSLISHELRTPLTGILNALHLLTESASGEGVIPAELPLKDLLGIAMNNAQRLSHSLSSLLDLAAIESGAFHARLREVDFPRLAVTRISGFEPRLGERRVEYTVDAVSSKGAEAQVPLLADPHKMARAVDLCLEILLSRVESGTAAHFEADSTHFAVSFDLQQGTEDEWETDWTQAQAGFKGGVVSPVSAFSGTVRSEREFLSRSREGLGSEFLLGMEILRLHRGTFTQSRSGRRVRLELRVPKLASDEGVRAVLVSRTYESSHSLESLAFGWIAVPRGEDARTFQQRLKKSLFRSSDAVYLLEEKGRLALVMDDCKKEDSPRLMARIEKILGQSLAYGLAHCPEEGVDPDILMALAAERLSRSNKTGA